MNHLDASTITSRHDSEGRNCIAAVRLLPALLRKQSNALDSGLVNNASDSFLVIHHNRSFFPPGEEDLRRSVSIRMIGILGVVNPDWSSNHFGSIAERRAPVFSPGLNPTASFGGRASL